VGRVRSYVGRVPEGVSRTQRDPQRTTAGNLGDWCGPGVRLAIEAGDAGWLGEDFARGGIDALGLDDLRVKVAFTLLRADLGHSHPRHPVSWRYPRSTAAIFSPPFVPMPGRTGRSVRRRPGEGIPPGGSSDEFPSSGRRARAPMRPDDAPRVGPLKVDLRVA
jgi:hypothetical protein